MTTTGHATRTQQDRSVATRERLIDATIACLVRDGYAKTTIAATSAAAGVTRGAHRYHFTTQSEAGIAAVEHLAGQRLRELRDLGSGGVARGDLPPRQAALDLVWSVLSGDLYVAALELWHAAAHDDELRAALVRAERGVGRELAATLRDVLVGDGRDTPALDHAIDVVGDAMRGLASRRTTLGAQQTAAVWAQQRPRLARYLAAAAGDAVESHTSA